MNIIEMIFGQNKISRLIESGSFKTIGTSDTLYYLNSPNLMTIHEVNTQYQYYDIKSTDIVLDIGACIGAFSLKVRNKVNKVYAVEPLMTEYLKEHIKLNNVTNITVLEYALGTNIMNLSWKYDVDIVKQVKGLPLTQLINLAGGYIDFLKCDCEGGEWYIQEKELQDIRRIEMEVHLDENHPDSSYFDKILTNNEFNYTKTYLTDTELTISAGKK